MSDTASNTGVPRTRPTEGESARIGGGGAISTGSGLIADDDLTIVTRTPPLPCPAAADSTDRILEGRVMPGARLGQFELLEYVGGGGMGRVYRARDVRLGRTVALKILPPEQARDADAAQRFQNEAQSAARLNHENIARVYFAGEDRGLSYIAFEFIEGENVRALVERKGPLSLDEAVGYTLQAAEALAHAEAREVVHRDIKPSNMLITPEGRVKLIDMGLARLQTARPSDADLTASGVTLGTFDYISPEQARDPRSADVRSDIYSLGCTLFFMLSGQPPFPEGTVLQKLLQHQADDPPDVRRWRPDVPEELSRLLRKMMAKEPRSRPANPDELIAELSSLAAGLGLRPLTANGMSWQPAPRPVEGVWRRHLPWIAPVAALLCAVLLLDRFWSFPAARDELLPPPAARMPRPTALAPAAKQPAPNPTPAKTAPPAENDQSDQSWQLEWYNGSFNGDTNSLFGQWDLSLPSDFEDGIRPQSSPSPRGAAPAEAAKDAGKQPEGPAQGNGRTGVLVVGDGTTGGNEYSSLGAACAAARDGEVIELRYNGPREERPMKISNLRLEIRAAAGYRPAIVFRPTEINPVKYPRSMLILGGGRLTLADVSLELHVPRDLPADNWTLLETWGGQSLRMERCVLTVSNASDQLTSYHAEAAFVRARPAPDAAASESVASATPLARLELVNTIARGEAVFLAVEDLQPISLLWDNGLLATSDALLWAGGGQFPPKADEALRLDLRHLTAAVRGGLCRLSATEVAPYQLAVHIVAADNIILGAPGAALVEQQGAADVEQARRRLVFNGDRNFYQDIENYWVVRTNDPEIPADVMSFEAWKNYWGPSRENQPSREPLLWRRPPNADRPMHMHTASDYMLEDPTFGDTSEGAPGCRGELLPAPPPDVFFDRPAAADSQRRPRREPAAG